MMCEKCKDSNDPVKLRAEIERLRSALRGMLALDEQDHQRGGGDIDICAEVRFAYEVLTPNVEVQASGAPNDNQGEERCSASPATRG